MNQEKWFAYSPEDGVEIFASAEEAAAAAQSLLDVDRDYAVDNGEWPYGTDQICWGQVLGQATESSPNGQDVEFSLSPLNRSQQP